MRHDFLAGGHLHPDDLLLAGVGFLHRRVDAFSITGVISTPVPSPSMYGMMGLSGTEREILVDPDLFAAGRDLDVLIGHGRLN
jgi:hypothetical protein